uniref:F-box domain-containing protein n=1 Tax=Mycena chlorophos TaxID=658473 RepID=A0ABQ0LJQ8_MYCCL|nr:predicted protein [Mycena chlorophos]
MVGSLLALPSELLIACLVHVPAHTLRTCLRVSNRILSTTILTSPELLFVLELADAGLTEDPLHPAVDGAVITRRAALHARERHWRTFAFLRKFEVSSTLDAQDVQLWDSDGDWFAVALKGEGDVFVALYVVRTRPADGAGLDSDSEVPLPTRTWRRVEIPDALVGFMLVSELDLVVLVTISPDPQDAMRQQIQIQSMRLSVDGPHPAQPQPIEVTSIPSSYGPPTVHIEMSGSTLCVAVSCFWHTQTESVNRVHLFEWPSGRRLDDSFEQFLTAFALVNPTLFLQTHELPESAATGFCGRRFVYMAEREEGQEGRRVTMLDFNPGTIRWARRLLADQADGSSTVQLENATVRLLDADDAAGTRLQHSALTEPIVSELAYVEITSTERFDWEGVHMNGASVIGEQVDDSEDEWRLLEILHLG